MGRIYKRKIGVKFMNYTDDNLKQAIQVVSNNRMTIRQAAARFGIPKSTLSDKIKNRHEKKQGGQQVLSVVEKNRLTTGIMKCAEWGYPLTRREILYLVKNYLDRKGVKSRFKDNLPGNEWFYTFMKRNNHLTERLAQNIKRCRAAVTKTMIQDYFDNLSFTLQSVLPSHIINYDETNITDDPGSVKVVSKRGSKRVERVIDWSKSSTSVMMSITGSGIMLPPYVVYKSVHLYPTWIEGGVPGAVYNRTKSGWFDGPTFEDWFHKIALPYLKNLDGKKNLLGDNLSSHVSIYVIESCEKYNIELVFFPPNTTHLLQPLDVAFFAPFKKAWRKVLADWKIRNRGCIPKSEFPPPPAFFNKRLTVLVHH